VPRTKSKAKTATAPNADEQLLKKQDIAQRCRLSLRTIDRWVNERKIPYLNLDKRTVRFRWGDVKRVIDRLAVKEVTK
jgi:predicted DNA-binding transcriptional regulator AlpA